MEGKNCPNCGAAYTLEDVKCPFCGTLYFDLTAIDFTRCEPVFIKMRVPNGQNILDITQCAYPRLGNIEYITEYSDAIGMNGAVIKRFCTGHRMQTNISFDAVPFGNNKSMMEVRTIGD